MARTSTSHVASVVRMNCVLWRCRDMVFELLGCRGMGHLLVDYGEGDERPRVVG